MCKKNDENNDSSNNNNEVKGNTKNPEWDANIFSQLWFAWAGSLFKRATELRKENSALEQEDLLPLPSIDLGKNIAPVFEDYWVKQQQEHEEEDQSKNKKKSKPPTITSTMKIILGKRFIFAGVVKAINSSLQFAFPLLLSEILRYIEDIQNNNIPSDSDLYTKYRGYWLSAILFVAMGVKAVTENYYFSAVYRAGYHARVALTISVYNKALRLSSAERHGTTLGELINLMQVDASKIEMFVPQFHVLWDGLFQIIGYMTILYTLIGWPCFAGLFIMLLAGPVQAYIMKQLFAQNRKLVKYTDDRVKITNEAVQGIRCVKMYTWEESFHRVIGLSRNSELNFLRTIAYYRGASRAYMGALPNIVAVVSFVVYALVVVAAKGEEISASTLFAALVAFGQLRFPLLFYPLSLAQLAQAMVSAKRVEDFLRLKEVRKEGVGTAAAATNDDDDNKKGGGKYDRNNESLKTGEIVLEDVTVYWGDPDVPLPKRDEDDISIRDDSSVNLNNSRHSKSSIKKQVDVTDIEVVSTASGGEVRYPKAILQDISVRIQPNELCAVIGRVGSGKTTFCSAILNEAVIGRGSSVGLKGSVAYAAQSPWILNATIRDNIIFGCPFDREKYETIIAACQLTHDLSILDAGDQTEIGEKGINLSGGQKQRVSLARAAYSDADIMILDDPLSALDPEVGKKLFEECILTLMKGKTRLMVTNQSQCLPSCDSVVALGKKGRVVEQGTYEDLSNKQHGEVQKLLEELKSKKKENTDNSDSAEASKDEKKKIDGATATLSRKSSKTPSATTTPATDKKKEDQLVTKEERNKGAVSHHVYKKYVLAGGGFSFFAPLLVLFVVCTANDFVNTYWISLWTADANYQKYSRAFYLGLYALFSVTQGIFTFYRSFILARFGVRASQKLHDSLLSSILRAPMSFFDTTPTGRILSRFSKDLYSIDLELTDCIDFVISCTLTVLTSLVTIVFVTPLFGIAIIPLLWIYIRALNYFRNVSRETKRLDSISRSPVFAHFSETLGGLGTIRAYDQASRFTSEFESKVDVNTQAYYNNKTADRWLSVRLDFLGAVIVGLAGVFACQVAISGSLASATASNTNFASYAGLSLSYSISLTGLLNWVVRSFAQMEAAMNSAERILYYTEEIAQEAPAKSDDMTKELQAPLTNTKLDSKGDIVIPPPPPYSVAMTNMGGQIETPDSNWPSKGEIVLNDLKMRYRPENPLVLKGLNVTFTGGSRIGVVGRTGSGKSSLLLVLMRIVEPALPKEDDKYTAPITVDGVDVLRIGLTDLRSKIAIIPQNPVLFSGTIRSNMDPFDEHNDEAIWDALEGCSMKETIEDMPDLLQSKVAEYGENLSQGQRQLLCLGRALLKNCRILLLDEATSSVDYETDKDIQRTLREAFTSCTVLTIAHRVNTIMDSDKILVMDDGRMAEYASPKELLANESSAFADIVRHSQEQTNE
eukprot:CAMPEP_0194159732 /NCGR_PEP_ID=MMETSP0152-20130528/78003_1 /TAXON_ID=1049557 /ORGANISM="Thalassiothrix antarctica, Strain L6-D1" /LENGTH=1449 /DNA_ID=CAMNT_0038869347 /DNA_START=172 /DNA_END=4521 /DNA_ORIENTATION=-